MKRFVLLGALSSLLLANGYAAEQDHSQHQHQEHHQHGGSHDHSASSESDEPTESERAHVPPPPPQHVMGEMFKERMAELMQMEDDSAFLLIRLDQFEWRETEDAKAWEAQAWYGGDYDKLWLETEGESIEGEESGRVELLWDRIFTKWWSLQAGVRQDFGAGPSRTWAAVGVQGLAPYFFEVDATLYVGEQGRTAARLSVETDFLITQRLILQPQLELEAFGKKDLENGVGSGLSGLELGLRLRYELRRELAPYVGAHWRRKLGSTEDIVRGAGEDSSDFSLLVGVRAWF